MIFVLLNTEALKLLKVDTVPAIVRIRFSVVCALLLVMAQSAFCEILPADRHIPWQGNVGVAGGIPNVTTIYKTLSSSGGDDTSQIQNAIDNCPANEVVLLGPGTFILSHSIYMTSNMVLRGSGPGTTIMQFNSGPLDACISFYGPYNPTADKTGVPIAVDCVKGQSTVTLSSMPSWVKVGAMYIIDQLDDPSFVMAGSTNIYEAGDDFRYAAVTTAYGHRGMAQTVRVTAIHGNTVTLEIPLYYGWQPAQQAMFWESIYDPPTQTTITRSGIENLTLHGNFTADQYMIKMQTADSCWVKNIESNTTPGYPHVYTVFCYRCEIRDSYFHDSNLSGPGEGYGIALYYNCSAMLVENNILKNLHVGMQTNYGTSGSVFGYNYAFGGEAASNAAPSISAHGSHSYMNLFEGNFCDNPMDADIVHGSSSHGVLFRNVIHGLRQTPEAQIPVALDYYNRFYSIVGNILGVVGIQTSYQQINGQPCNSESNWSIYAIGYVNSWGCNTTGKDGHTYYDTLTASDPIRTLNWDAVNQSVVVDPAIPDTSLPNSYYLSAKPGWFGSLAWPPFDPNHPSTAVATNIAAGYRYTNGSNPPSGAATPAPPTNLRLIGR
jgi:hypothetical protein